MVSDTTKKWIGIFIIVAMAGSLIAGGLMYMDPDKNPLFPATEETEITSTPSTFEYDLSFNTTVLSELNSIRVALETNSINIGEINTSIRELDSVSKITQAQFVKYESGQYYFAEIDLKRTATISEAFDTISSLEYFIGFKEGMKKVTIAVPETVTLVNTDLNIDRPYTFEYETSAALVVLSTMPNDQISVNGKISLQGNTILSLELSEVENNSNKAVNYKINKTLPIIELGENLNFDGTISKDINQTIFTDSLKEIDTNAQVYFFDLGDNLTFFGQTKLENTSKVQEIFSEAEEINLTQSAKFNLGEIFITELDQNFVLDKNSFNTNINLGKKLNDEVNLEITIGITKSNASVVSATPLN